MNLSAAGLKLITDSEGFRSRVYKDTAGLDTIGYGHRVLRAEDFPHAISADVALKLLEGDVSWAEHAVNSAVKVALTQGQFDALVDWTYNLGAGRLFHSLFLEMLNEGRYAGVPAELARYVMAGGHSSAGLARRRAAEAVLWERV